MKKILLCGLKYEMNFGDTIINKCTKKILENELNKHNIQYSIEEIDLTGRCDFNRKFNFRKIYGFYVKSFFMYVYRLARKISKILKLKQIVNIIDYKIWLLSDEHEIFKQIYRNKIKESDTIIFVGGGILKYKYQNFYNYINYVTKWAERYNKKVFFSAVGVEGFDITNYKCKKLKEALNRDCVTMITTRDDLENLHKYIERNEIVIKKVADPAVYVDEIYHKKKNAGSNIIGLCVCRDKLFVENDIQYTENDLLELWKDLIVQLEQKDYKWIIYTNGLEADNNFALKLIKYIGMSEKQDEICMIPKSDTELVDIISKFGAVIATRLHSCIISYSLDIPAIGLVWNNKLKLFGQNIGYKDRFIEKRYFEPRVIVEKMENAIKEGYRTTDPNFKPTIKKSIAEIVEKYIKEG